MLAGRVVDAIVKAEPVSTVVGLAVLIAVIAVAEAGLGLATHPDQDRHPVAGRQAQVAAEVSEPLGAS